MTDEATNRAGPFATPRPEMRGRYLIRHPLKAAAISAIDATLALVVSHNDRAASPIKRILVANWAHLGDVIISLGVLSALRRRYPEAMIGMLVGSWGRPAVAGTGLADHLHVVDHWRLDRSGRTKAEKRARYRETRAAALEEIVAIGYDVAIDLFPFFPPTHPLFRRAGIPVRVGFDSGGLGPLLTRPVAWRDDDRPMADRYRDLLDMIEPARPYAPVELRPQGDPAGLAPQPEALVDAHPYIVLHPGAGVSFKDWGVDRWDALIDQLSDTRPGFSLVLTGAGASEKALTQSLAQRHRNVIDMAGRVDWDGFVGIVARASLVVCPDTVTGHVAALFDTPVISLFTGTNKPGQWKPYSDQAHVIVQPVACAPCNRPGCTVMACIRDTGVDEVMAAVDRLLPSSLVSPDRDHQR